MTDGSERQPDGILGVAGVIAEHLLNGDHSGTNTAIEKALETFGPDELANAIRKQMNDKGKGNQ